MKPGELAKETLSTCDKKVSSIDVAKLLVKRYPKVFTSVEHARGIVRYYRGRNGAKSKEKLASSRFVLPLPTKKNPLSLPKSDNVPKPPHEMPKSISKLLVLADIHIPYQDNDALTCALNWGKSEGIDGVLLLGDTMDCYSLSTFDKDPMVRDFVSEMENCRQFFGVLRNLFGMDIPIYMREGNHEYRFTRLLMNKAPQLLYVEEFRLPKLLKFNDYGVQFIPSKTLIRFDKLNLIHGDEFQGRGGGVNPARNLYLRAQDFTLAAHCHRTSQYTDRGITGKILSTWTIGCLCNLSPEWNPFNKWNHGAAIIHRHADKGFEVDSKRFVDGKMY